MPTIKFKVGFILQAAAYYSQVINVLFYVAISRICLHAITGTNYMGSGNSTTHDASS